MTTTNEIQETLARAGFPILACITEAMGSPAFLHRTDTQGRWLGDETPCYVYEFSKDTDLSATSAQSFLQGEDAVIELRGHSARVVWADGCEHKATSLTVSKEKPESGVLWQGLWYTFTFNEKQ